MTNSIPKILEHKLSMKLMQTLIFTSWNTR